MPYIAIWIHAVWATKSRERIISKEIKPKLLAHMKENAKSKKIYINEMNCEPEHVHALISLSADQSISEVMQLIKGESSYWINQNKLTKVKFGWQDEYFAVSVSKSQIASVKKYIRNQEEHHRRKSYTEECEEFISKYGFDKYKI
ncbi:MAG: IS200/IS605 family transposase [Ignavibacteriae bacterium]|nr:IS200/IS605 family transposase [Ignavibacteriota bacterium]NOG99635.1 IS200/IS605 family transposase [Ignavibacteriota bacterium]